MYCTQCGKQIDDDSKFCTQCGAKIVPDNNESKTESRHIFVTKPQEQEVSVPISVPEKTNATQGKNGILNIRRLIFLLIIAIIVIVLAVVAINTRKNALEKKPEYRVQNFIDEMQAGDYDSAGYDLSFPSSPTSWTVGFGDFAEECLVNADYIFDIETNELQIKTDSFTYHLYYVEDGEDWYLQADDFLMAYKMRCLSLIWEETDDRNWEIGRIVEEEYIGDGLTEFTLMQFKKPQITLKYCIETGSNLEGTAFESSRPSVYATLNVDENGNITSIDGIYNLSTGEILEGGIDLNGTLQENTFTVERYMLGPNYLDKVAKIPYSFIFDIIESAFEEDITFEEYQEKNDYWISNTESLCNYYKAAKIIASRSVNPWMADFYEVTEYDYNHIYYLGDEYHMTVKANLYTDNRYKVDSVTAEVTFIPGCGQFILHELSDY